jgi:hypothetical protein
MLLKQLSEAFGVSGAEGEVRDVLRQDLYNVGKTKTDALGNLYIQKTAKHNKPILMLCAHMDEVGLMVKHIENNGLLRFDTVGGIDDRILVSKNVIIGSIKYFLERFPSWPKGADCKSAGNAFGGSNPPLSTIIIWAISSVGRAPDS